MATRTAAAGTLSAAVEIFETDSSLQQLGKTPLQHRRVRTNKMKNTSTRWLEQSLGTTDNSADDDDEDDEQSTPSSMNGTSVCTPVGECELCPHNYKVLIEKEDEKIKGEYDSCVKYGRRMQFECTVLFQENESSEKIAQSLSEYRPCRYTDSDEQFRMLRMQVICLLTGVWFLRNVRRQKVASASLFDQRRMRIQSSANGSSAMPNVKYSVLKDKNSMETIELTRTIGAGKIPRSPAPDPISQAV